MAENTIFIKKYDGQDNRFAVNEREMLRYSGYMGLPEEMDDSLRALYAQVIDELKTSFSYKICYRRMPIEWREDFPVLPFEHQSKDLAKCLKGSSEIIMFAATIGLDIDRFIAKYQRLKPVKALLMQAYGAERVETLCNVFCQEILQEVSKEGLCTTARFSPGYGDLPLEVQKDFFSLLDCNRQVGISLNESLLMTPSKSVTAIFGLGKEVISRGEHKCSQCLNKSCSYRDENN